MCSQHKVSMGKTWPYIVNENSESVMVMNTAQNKKSLCFLKFCNLYGATIIAFKVNQDWKGRTASLLPWGPYERIIT